MNYNIDLPEELKVLSIPNFKVNNNELTIINKPSPWDLLVPFAFLMIFFVMILNGQLSFQDSDYDDYLILAIGLFLLVMIQYTSLNKVSIDFEQKAVLIKNYNPLVNIGRKILKRPFSIPFNEIEKVFPDWKFAGKSIYNDIVVLQTIAPYKFTIAIFSNKAHSVLLSEYLNRKIKTEQ